MTKTLAKLLLVPVLLSLFVMAGCEDDDSLSGTATVTGNVRQFYSPSTIAAKAAAGVTIELRLVDGGWSKTATSEADGTFRFENVPAGSFELIMTGGGLTGTITLTVAEGSTTDLVDIIVKADGTTREGAVVKTEPVVETTPAPATSAPAAPAPKVQWIDQQHDAGVGQYSFFTGRSVGQGFTVGATNGNIIKVEVDIWNPGGRTKDVTLTIKANDPNGAALGTATIAAGDIAGMNVFESVTFSPGIPVTAGATYAIVLSTTEAMGSSYPWRFANPGTYAGGAVWYENPVSSGTLVVNAGYDVAFKVWLEK